jgi:hypothetical protein
MTKYITRTVESYTYNFGTINGTSIIHVGELDSDKKLGEREIKKRAKDCAKRAICYRVDTHYNRYRMPMEFFLANAEKVEKGEE